MRISDWSSEVCSSDLVATQYGREVPDVDADVLDYLMGRVWPGNVRELRHVVERVFVFCEDDRLRMANFESAGNRTEAASRPSAQPVATRVIENGGLRDELDRYEREIMDEEIGRASCGGRMCQYV